MPEEGFGAIFEVTVDGTLVEDVADVRVDQALDLPAQTRLRVREANTADGSGIVDLFAIGATLEVKTAGPDSDVAQPIFTGDITEIDIELSTRGWTIEAVAHDRSHRMSHGVERRTFLDQTDQQILRTLAGDHGLTTSIPASPGQRHTYLLQTGTDLDLFTERVRAVGAAWHVEGTEMIVQPLVDSSGSLTVTWGEDLLAFRARASMSEAATRVEVRAWDPTNQRALTNTAPLARSTAAPGSELGQEAAREGVGQPFGGDRFRGNGAAADEASVEVLSKALVERAAAELSTARGECMGDPAAKPGVKLTVAGAPDRINGDYRLTRVVHTIGGGDYTCRFECGGSEPRRLVDLLGGGSVDGKTHWAHRAMVIGIVTNNRGDSDHRSMVKVKFPTLSDTEESAWARVLSIGAGNNRGLQSYPEVNDEVLVCFEHGDTTRPIVLGGLWSGRHTAPADADTDGNKLFTLRSLRGSEMILQDADGSDNLFKVALHGNKGLMQLAQTDPTKIDSRSDIEIDGDKKITIKAVGDLTIEAANITLKATSGAVKAEGATNVELKAGVAAKVEGTTVEAKGSASAKVDGGGMTEIKGGIVKLN